MRIWELHGMQCEGAIRSTPDGEADVLGLVFSEKAYLLTLRDYRPHQLVSLVRGAGPAAAAETLANQFQDIAIAAAGRGLVIARGASGPVLRRSDELKQSEPAGRRP
ncbi:MAG TPA: hypothetical protein VIH05_10360 [Tepidiformaceae bacterium]